MKNQKGFITIDFIFAIVLIMGFTGVLFKLMFTLSVASLTQYITFASARNYTAAHITQDLQKERAIAKYKELISNVVIKPLYTNGWYKVDTEPTVGDIAEVVPGYQQPGDAPNQFWGSATHFNAKVLDFNIPFFGSTTPEGDGSGAGFTTFLGSYLGREITTEECLKFVAARWQKIRALQVSGGSSYSTSTSDSGYMPIADDGC